MTKSTISPTKSPDNSLQFPQPIRLTLGTTSAYSNGQTGRVRSSLPIAERKFLRAKDAADFLSISKSHFYQLVKEGVLPPGKLVSGAVRVWRLTSLDAAAEKMWDATI